MAKVISTYAKPAAVMAIQSHWDKMSAEEKKVVTTLFDFGYTNVITAIVKGQTNPLSIQYKGDDNKNAKDEVKAILAEVKDPKTPEARVRQIVGWAKDNAGLELLLEGYLELRDMAKAQSANGNAKKAATPATGK